MNAVTLKSWRVVFLVQRDNPRFRPLPVPVTVQAESAEAARDRACDILNRVTGKFSKVCFITEARA